MIDAHDDQERVTDDDWYADDDNEPRDECLCPFCLLPEQRDPAGRLVFCCRAAAAAFEES